MKKFGLIGRGIAGSGSPALFEAAFGGRYQYSLLDGDDFKVLLERFRKNLDAVNVTAPFKISALEAADDMSETAELCEAANMLIKTPDGRILADNSDLEGVTLSLISAYAVGDFDVDTDDEDSLDEFISGKTALVVGCGGAGKAAVAAAVTLGYGKTIIMNRTVKKAEEYRDYIIDFYGDIGKDEIEVRPVKDFTECFKAADVVIYTLPEGAPLPCSDEDLEAIKESATPSKIVFEANYKTPVLEGLSGKCTYLSGLNWLYNQAVVAYETFTGETPDEEAMKKVL